MPIVNTTSQKVRLMPVSLILDNRLSMEALGLHVYLLTIPNGDHCTFRDLADRFGCSQTKVARAWRELVQAGWISQRPNSNKIFEVLP